MPLTETVQLLGAASQEWAWFAEHGWEFDGVWHWTFKPLEGDEEVHSLAHIGFDDANARAALEVGAALGPLSSKLTPDTAWRLESGIRLPETGDFELRILQPGDEGSVGIRLRPDLVQLGSYSTAAGFVPTVGEDLTSVATTLAVEFDGRSLAVTLSDVDGAPVGHPTRLSAEWLKPLDLQTVFEFVLTKFDTTDIFELKDTTLSLGNPSD